MVVGEGGWVEIGGRGRARWFGEERWVKEGSKSY